ncbi:MAG TPA: glycosyltransferase 87 family protein [Actinomycetota bacterium]|nr:glycosyltransferase 87 family protein [Actinomycetota bacterium]
MYSLYFFRSLDVRPFPYVHGDGKFDNERRADGTLYESGDLEYPALTGIMIGVVAEVVHNGAAFFHVTAGVLAVFGLLVVVLLWLLVAKPGRLFYFTAAPSLILYAFHNWDLLAVVLMCAGLVAFHRRADGLTGMWLGLGAAAKVFPGLILPALVLARRRETEKVPWRMIGAAAAGFVAVNLPFAIINRAGWWGPWSFQATRFPNFETSWYNIYRHLSSHFGDFWAKTYPGFTSDASAALFVGFALLLLWRESRRGTFRPYATSFGILLIWLLTAKVYSPQYALWVLPFFVLIEIPWPGFAAFAITDAAVWVTVSWFFVSFAPTGAGNEARLAPWLEGMVWARYAVLLVLLWMSRRAGENVIQPIPPSREPSAGRQPAPVESSA